MQVKERIECILPDLSAVGSSRGMVGAVEVVDVVGINVVGVDVVEVDLVGVDVVVVNVVAAGRPIPGTGPLPACVTAAVAG